MVSPKSICSTPNGLNRLYYIVYLSIYVSIIILKDEVMLSVPGLREPGERGLRALPGCAGGLDSCGRFQIGVCR